MKRTLWKVLFGLGTALAASVMTVPAMAAEPVELEFLSKQNGDFQQDRGGL